MARRDRSIASSSAPPAASRPSGEWSDDDYDVLAEGAIVGRIFKASAGAVGSPWIWTFIFLHHEDRTPTHGNEPTQARRKLLAAGIDLEALSAVEALPATEPK